MPGKKVKLIVPGAAVCLLFVLWLSGCNQGPRLDSATSGKIKMSVDETFFPVFDSELIVFHSLYKHATILPSYVSEGQAMKEFLADSSSLVVLSRNLNAEEKKYFKDIEITPRLDSVAIDAIAFVINPGNTDTALTVEQLEQVFTGKVGNWHSLDSLNESMELRVVFDNTSSSTARYVKERFKTELPSYCFAVNNNAEVVKYVAENKNALGVIGVNWISDSHDSTAINFKQDVKVLRVITEASGPRGKQPYQAYIANGSYPFTRHIYMVSRQGRSGLATGFISFVASHPGQLIIQKAGLLPVTMPVRIIGFSQ